MNTFQITRDIPRGDQIIGDLVLWSGDAVLSKMDVGRNRGVQWFDTNCRDRGTVIRPDIVILLIGRIPKDYDEIIKFSVVDGDLWQLTTDKHKDSDDYRSHGDIVLWTSYAILGQDDYVRWWDIRGMERGTVVDITVIDILFDDKIPSWKDKEIIKFGIKVDNV